MSQFRIKQIDQGLPDDWTFRIDDDGLIVGDDVTASDPNELAVAITETQDLLLKASSYSPSQLIDPAHGVLERVKIIEDTFGATSLQDAYVEGNIITVQAGRPLTFGSGHIELDSSGNLKFSPTTMKIYNGVLQMNMSYQGITSSTTSLTFGTASGSIDTTVTSNRNLYLKDGNLLSSVPLSESGHTSLVTTNQSIISAINEISSGFNAASFQQIYNQSSPPEIRTSFANSSLRLINDTGNPSTPAVDVQGKISCDDNIHADGITIGPGATVNCTIASDGSINTSAIIETTTKVKVPNIESSIGDLNLKDIRGNADLTELSDAALTTTKTSIFGSINEVNALANTNAASILVLENEHDLVTGNHKIINTQAIPGGDSISRITVKNSSGADRITMNGNGDITANEVTLGTYSLSNEASLNVAHRTGNGSDHANVVNNTSAINNHIADSSTHGITGNVVGTTDVQVLTNKTIDGALNSLSGLAHGSEVDSPSSGVHGVTGAIVGTTDVQILSGKTLTSPTVNSPVLNGTTSGTAIKDEDDFISDSDVHLATQQSIKKYVDDKIETVDSFLDMSDTPASFSVGRILFESNASVTDSANFVWDIAQSRLGISVAGPTEAIDVSGNINASGAVKIGGIQVLKSQETDVLDAAALQTVETADATYDSTEQDMLNHLKADVTELRNQLNAALQVLRNHGLMG